ncbi:cupin domain-containing protein [Bradyrhizobium shewense]|uniref:cupin domain-containing protein n=1 Tax=Bradyrhizobium shewense TaxID=1761772 RepID=UPI000A5209D2|nr:cupin domain-containing protein [Bradyrhizobium shewense]
MQAPDAIPKILGKSLIALEVDYVRRGLRAPRQVGFHLRYVISGAIESKVNDGYAPLSCSESWYEPPGVIHSISRNASKTEPAKPLAVFVLDTNDNTLTMPTKYALDSLR